MRAAAAAAAAAADAAGGGAPSAAASVPAPLSAAPAVTRSCLAAQSRLQILDLTANRLTRLGGALDACAALEDLWLGYNRLAAFADVDAPRLRASCPRLATLYLEHCPLARDYEYRMRLARELPSLRQIDADQIPGRA